MYFRSNNSSWGTQLSKKRRPTGWFLPLLIFALSSLTFSTQSDKSPSSSTIATAQKLLEDLQFNAYSQLGKFPKQYSEKDLERASRESDKRLLNALSSFPGVNKDRIDKLRKDLAAARKSLGRPALPTKYEDRLAYETMLIIANQIDVKAAEYRRTHPFVPNPVPSRSQIVFGTVPSGRIEAYTYLVNPIEKDEAKQVFLIIFESGLMRFAEIMSNAIILAMPQDEPKGTFLALTTNRAAIEKRLDLNPAIIRDFYDALSTYVLKGGPYLSTQPAELAEPYASFASFLYRSSLVFAMGHEYGHVIFTQGRDYLTIDPHWPKGWHEEFFADGWGVTLSLMAASSNSDLESTILGARFFFLCFDLIERALSMIQTGRDVYRAQTDHPAANRRAERLSRYLLGALRNFWNVEPESLNDFNSLIETSESLDIVAGVLWDRIKPKLLKLHNDGARIAPSWNAFSLLQN